MPSAVNIGALLQATSLQRRPVPDKQEVELLNIFPKATTKAKLTPKAKPTPKANTKQV
jgi:hypothetical protein